MSAEESARRMTALLARRPRSARTRAYLDTLPQRRKIVVTADDYPVPKPPPEPATAPPEPPKAARARKDKRRPRACPAPPPPPPAPKPEPVSRWACRPSNRQQPWRGEPRTLLEQKEKDARREMLGDAQGWLCALCGVTLIRNGKATQDHVIPHALGGMDALGNLVLAHSPCNNAKANDIPTGCEMIWLFAVNARLGVEPTRY